MKKPMLGCSEILNIDNAVMPCYASPKLDGIRCLVGSGSPVSRTLKPTPNKHVQSLLSSKLDIIVDGELMVSGEFDKVQSAIQSVHGKPDFTYNVFDVQAQLPFSERLALIDEAVELLKADGVPVRKVEQVLITTREDLKSYYEQCLTLGYEGIIVRSVDSPYKHGRSTMLQGWLLKVKPKDDDEGVIVAINPLVREDGTADESLMGSLTLSWRDTTFNLGTGFSQAHRKAKWHIGDVVTFLYEGVGSQGRPRFPSLKNKRLPE